MLKTRDEVLLYLTSPGTCKCGLRCPFQLDESFSFDPEILSLPDNADSGSLCKFTSRACSHRKDTSHVPTPAVATAAGHSVMNPAAERERLHGVRTPSSPYKNGGSSTTRLRNHQYSLLHGSEMVATQSGLRGFEGDTKTHSSKMPFSDIENIHVRQKNGSSPSLEKYDSLSKSRAELVGLLQSMNRLATKEMKSSMLTATGRSGRMLSTQLKRKSHTCSPSPLKGNPLRHEGHKACCDTTHPLQVGKYHPLPCEAPVGSEVTPPLPNFSATLTLKEPEVRLTCHSLNDLLKATSSVPTSVSSQSLASTVSEGRDACVPLKEFHVALKDSSPLLSSCESKNQSKKSRDACNVKDFVEDRLSNSPKKLKESCIPLKEFHIALRNCSPRRPGSFASPQKKAESLPRGLSKRLRRHTVAHLESANIKELVGEVQVSAGKKTGSISPEALMSKSSSNSLLEVGADGKGSANERPAGVAESRSLPSVLSLVTGHVIDTCSSLMEARMEGPLVPGLGVSKGSMDLGAEVSSVALDQVVAGGYSSGCMDLGAEMSSVALDQVVAGGYSSGRDDSMDLGAEMSSVALDQVVAGGYSSGKDEPMDLGAEMSLVALDQVVTGGHTKDSSGRDGSIDLGAERSLDLGAAERSSVALGTGGYRTDSPSTDAIEPIPQPLLQGVVISHNHWTGSSSVDMGTEVTVPPQPPLPGDMVTGSPSVYVGTEVATPPQPPLPGEVIIGSPSVYVGTEVATTPQPPLPGDMVTGSPSVYVRTEVATPPQPLLPVATLTQPSLPGEAITGSPSVAEETEMAMPTLPPVITSVHETDRSSKDVEMKAPSQSLLPGQVESDDHGPSMNMGTPPPLPLTPDQMIASGTTESPPEVEMELSSTQVLPSPPDVGSADNCIHCDGVVGDSRVRVAAVLLPNSDETVTEHLTELPPVLPSNFDPSHTALAVEDKFAVNKPDRERMVDHVTGQVVDCAVEIGGLAGQVSGHFGGVGVVTSQPAEKEPAVNEGVVTSHITGPAVKESVVTSQVTETAVKEGVVTSHMTSQVTECIVEEGATKSCHVKNVTVEVRSQVVGGGEVGVVKGHVTSGAVADSVETDQQVSSRAVDGVVSITPMMEREALVSNVNSMLLSSHQHVQSEIGETSSMSLRGSEEESQHSECPPVLMEEQEETERSHVGQQDGTETFPSSDSSDFCAEHSSLCQLEDMPPIGCDCGVSGGSSEVRSGSHNDGGKGLEPSQLEHVADGVLPNKDSGASDQCNSEGEGQSAAAPNGADGGMIDTCCRDSEGQRAASADGGMVDTCCRGSDELGGKLEDTLAGTEEGTGVCGYDDKGQSAEKAHPENSAADKVSDLLRLELTPDQSSTPVRLAPMACGKVDAGTALGDTVDRSFEADICTIMPEEGRNKIASYPAKDNTIGEADTSSKPQSIGQQMPLCVGLIEDTNIQEQSEPAIEHSDAVSSVPAASVASTLSDDTDHSDAGSPAIVASPLDDDPDHSGAGSPAIVASPLDDDPDHSDAGSPAIVASPLDDDPDHSDAGSPVPAAIVTSPLDDDPDHSDAVSPVPAATVASPLDEDPDHSDAGSPVPAAIMTSPLDDDTDHSDAVSPVPAAIVTSPLDDDPDHSDAVSSVPAATVASPLDDDPDHSDALSPVPAAIVTNQLDDDTDHSDAVSPVPAAIVTSPLDDDSDHSDAVSPAPAVSVVSPPGGDSVQSGGIQLLTGAEQREAVAGEAEERLGHSEGFSPGEGDKSRERLVDEQNGTLAIAGVHSNRFPTEYSGLLPAVDGSSKVETPVDRTTSMPCRRNGDGVNSTALDSEVANPLLKDADSAEPASKPVDDTAKLVGDGADASQCDAALDTTDVENRDGGASTEGSVWPSMSAAEQRGRDVVETERRGQEVVGLNSAEQAGSTITDNVESRVTDTDKSPCSPEMGKAKKPRAKRMQKISPYFKEYPIRSRKSSSTSSWPDKTSTKKSSKVAAKPLGAADDTPKRSRKLPTPSNRRAFKRARSGSAVDHAPSTSSRKASRSRSVVGQPPSNLRTSKRARSGSIVDHMPSSSNGQSQGRSRSGSVADQPSKRLRTEALRTSKRIRDAADSVRGASEELSEAACEPITTPSIATSSVQFHRRLIAKAYTEDDPDADVFLAIEELYKSKGYASWG